MKQQPTGKVILAGAGTGDPELITIKAVRYLKKAAVVITDRLVSEDILTTYVKPGAEIIYVGKQGGSENSAAQESINELIVKHALEGKLVVRLKGGDVAFFSNVLDELKALTEHNIPYEIIPGITAASGASAYAGIPLTARGYATSVRILTYYSPHTISDLLWKELAETEDTLVFYMSSANLQDIVEQLTKNNIAADKRLAVIEQATTPFQQITVIDLYNVDELLRNKKLLSPCLLIIGKVVGLHEQFAWLNNTYCTDFYFEPLVTQHTSKLNHKEIAHVS
jgi:uroporphyrin-III C-methyltransferase